MCVQGRHDKFFFNHKDTDYASRNAWAKVQQKYPGILEITKIPRAPNARQVKQNNAEHATKGGSSKTPSQGNKSLAHLNMIAHSCDNCDVCKLQLLTPQSVQNNDECVNTLTIANTHSPYLNYCEIILPRRGDKATQETLLPQETQKQKRVKKDSIVVPTLALIDTGAPHGSYVGTWIKQHDSNVIVDSNLMTQICSPINNSCTALTESISVCISLYNKDKLSKFKFDIKLKILSSLDDREYGLIIGLPDIKKHNLLHKLANQFIDAEVELDVEGLNKCLLQCKPYAPFFVK